MSDNNFYKREYKSKKAVTKCGYCSVEIKEENLENHCKSVHKKPKLAAGQRTLDSLFKTSSIADTAVPVDNNTADPSSPPPSKVLAFVSEDFSSVPSKLEDISNTLSALKSSIDSLQANKIPDSVKAVEVAPVDDRVDKLVLCKSITSILSNFSELRYDEDEKVVKCDLCSSTPSLGGKFTWDI